MNSPGAKLPTSLIQVVENVYYFLCPIIYLLSQQTSQLTNELFQKISKLTFKRLEATQLL